MKKLLFVFMVLVVLPTSPSAMAQLTKAQIKERQEVVKSSKKQLNEKASKLARKEAKRYSKQGWSVTPGSLPLEKQLDKAYLMQYEVDDHMLPKYMIGEAMSIGGNYDAARMQAIELAKQNIAGQIQTEVTALIDNTVANEQLNAGDAESITRSIVTSKNLISQSIGRTIVVVEAYRTLPNGNKEVMVKLAYGMDQALAIAKKAIRDDLVKKGIDLQDKLDQILGL